MEFKPKKQNIIEKEKQFSKYYEEKRKDEFHRYLGSASRYLQNKRIKKLLDENKIYI